MMKSLLLGLALLAYATSAEAAEAWTCSHPVLTGPATMYESLNGGPSITRFELSPPELIDDHHHLRYRIVQNDDHALVATAPVSRTENGQKDPTVEAWTVAINKATGELSLAVVSTSTDSLMSQTVHGKCLKN